MSDSDRIKEIAAAAVAKVAGSPALPPAAPAPQPADDTAALMKQLLQITLAEKIATYVAPPGAPAAAPIDESDPRTWDKETAQRMFREDPAKARAIVERHFGGASAGPFGRRFAGPGLAHKALPK